LDPRLRADEAPSTPLPFVARTLFRFLAKLDSGRLTLTLPDGQSRTFPGARPGIEAHLHIRDWTAISIMLRRSDIGVGECWRDGLIDSPDMTAFLGLCAANQVALEKVFYGNPLVAAAFRIAHLLRPNTRAGSKKNIHAHYDLGNAFYGLWLDETMSYSSAVFDPVRPMSLAQGQLEKYDRIIRELGIGAGDHVLEIGCGWGGFAERAAATTGCRVTGVTISRAQLEFAQARIARAGLADRVDLRFCDYRDLEGTYDRIVSIEMVEAVGERFWPGYFQVLHDRLKPGGRAMVQSIVIAEEAFEKYRRTSDFIREYIFPGGMLPTVARFAAEARRPGLRVGEAFLFGPDYAETLRRWRTAIDHREGGIRGLGFDEAFLKLWRFYLHYCEAGFEAGRIDVMQVELSRP